jgi:AAA15 family ATPase/GTPase
MLSKNVRLISSPSGYQVVESLDIQNFRCFRRLRLDGLKRINVIVGENASGKTSLLESLFLTAGTTSQVAIKLRIFRGFGVGIEVTDNRVSYESLWKDLFFDLDQRKQISIALQGSDNNTRSLKISYKPDAHAVGVLDQLSPSGAAVDAMSISPIVFEWKRKADRKWFAAQPHLTSDKGIDFGGSYESFPAIIFSPGFREAPPENAKRFSEIRRQKKEGRILDALRQEFPFIEDLSIEFNVGTPTIYASINSVKERLPLPLVSDGVHRLLSLLIAIETFANGIVLIDEIENGFYYKRFPSIWSLLLRFCKECNTQIFASTHSMECLQAILPTLESDENDFSLLRLERKEGESRARIFSGRDLRSAIEQEVEIR